MACRLAGWLASIDLYFSPAAGKIAAPCSVSYILEKYRLPCLLLNLLTGEMVVIGN